MTTTERQYLKDGLDHVKAVYAAIVAAGPDQEVIVCHTCRKFRTVKRGYDQGCPTCDKIRGVS